MGPTGPVGEKGPRVSTITWDMLQNSASCLGVDHLKRRCIYIFKVFRKLQAAYHGLNILFSKLMSNNDEY